MNTVDGNERGEVVRVRLGSTVYYYLADNHGNPAGYGFHDRDAADRALKEWQQCSDRDQFGPECDFNVDERGVPIAAIPGTIRVAVNEDYDDGQFWGEACERFWDEALESFDDASATEMWRLLTTRNDSAVIGAAAARRFREWCELLPGFRDPSAECALLFHDPEND